MENNNNNNDNNNHNNNSLETKNMEEDVSMDDEIDDAVAGSVQRHTTPVEGVDVSSSSSSNGVSTTGSGAVAAAVDAKVEDSNKNSVVSSTTGGEATLLRPGNIIMMTVSCAVWCSR